MSDLLEKIQVFADRATALEAKLATPEVASNPTEYGKLAKELAALRPAGEAAVTYRKLLADLEGARGMLEDGADDEELLEMARAEVEELEAQRESLEGEIRLLLLPRDPNDEKNAILEIRAGTGGAEAALFAMDLFRMYSRYAERRNWKVEPMSTSESEGGGLKEVIASVSGDQVFHRLKHERGVHRVQRVPATESQGRIHTSDRAPSPSSPRPKRSTSRSSRERPARSIVYPEQLAPGGQQRQRRPTPPCASRTFRPGSWCNVRTRRASTRTRRRR